MFDKGPAIEARVVAGTIALVAVAVVCMHTLLRHQVSWRRESLVTIPPCRGF